MKRIRRSHSGLLFVLAIALVTAWPASAAMVINLNFTANFNTNFGANAAAAQAAANYAATQFTNLYNDPIHVNITVDAVTGTSTLGQSSTFIFNVGYAALRAAVVL